MAIFGWNVADSGAHLCRGGRRSVPHRQGNQQIYNPRRSHKFRKVEQAGKGPPDGEELVCLSITWRKSKSSGFVGAFEACVTIRPPVARDCTVRRTCPRKSSPSVHEDAVPIGRLLWVAFEILQGTCFAAAFIQHPSLARSSRRPALWSETSHSRSANFRNFTTASHR